MFGRKGTPDIFGSYLGFMFVMEVKRPGQKPTELQLHELKEWALARAKARVVCSLEDAKNVLKDIVKGGCEFCESLTPPP